MSKKKSKLKQINVIDLSASDQKEDSLLVGGVVTNKQEFIAMLKTKGFDSTVRWITGEREPEVKSLNDILSAPAEEQSITREEVCIETYNDIERFVVGMLTDGKSGSKSLMEIQKAALDAKLNEQKSIMWLDKQVEKAITRMKRDGFAFESLRSKTGKKLIVKGTKVLEKEEEPW